MPGQLEDTSTSQHLEPRRPETGRLLLALLLMAAAMLATAFVGRQVVLASGTLRTWDSATVESATAAALERPALVDALLLWAHLTEPWLLFTLLAVLAVGLHWRGLVRRRALWVVPVGLVGWGLSITCKYIVGRPRPVPPDAITVADGYSYPSGHATGSTTAMILLVVLLWPLARRTWSRTLLVLGAVAVVVLTCLDRVYLGVHYPTDVLAGVVVASVMTAAALSIGLRPRPGPVAPPQSRRA